MEKRDISLNFTTEGFSRLFYGNLKVSNLFFTMRIHKTKLMKRRNIYFKSIFPPQKIHKEYVNNICIFFYFMESCNHKTSEYLIMLTYFKP
jgi:hypothetical protein